MTPTTKLILGLFLTVATTSIKAQDETLQDQLTRMADSMRRSLLYTGIETSTTPYINTTTKDSTGTAPFVSLYVNYHHKSNFGLRANTYYLTKGDNSGFYLTSLTGYYANYRHKLVPVVAYTRFIQHDNASIPYSPMSNEIFGQLRMVTPIVDPAIGVDIGFGNDKENNDEAVSNVNLFASVSRWFAWQGESNMAVAFVPTLQLNAGTDRYYSFLRTTRYVSRNQSLKGMTHGRNGNGWRWNDGDSLMQEVDYVLSETNEFSLSNIELNGYLQFSFGRFSIAPSGSVYFPLRGEDRSAYGYWQLNVNYAIR
ncbi:MAG: hypothetical protein ACO1OO_05620 [Flavisolibacter sp.]